MGCRPEWFGGDQNAILLYEQVVELAHIWDDLVDRDKPVSNEQINRAFHIALFLMPANPLYDQLRHVFTPMWAVVAHAYTVANHFEAEKDLQGLEISHNLRYAGGHLLAYLMVVCIGEQEARKHMPDLWKEIVNERFQDYLEEHTC
jgi:hypothetical protein